MYWCNWSCLYCSLYICFQHIHHDHCGLYPVLLYHSFWLGFQRMDFLVICPRIFLRALPSVFWLIIPDRTYFMLRWDYFDALVFWHARYLARIRARLFAGLHCYFCLGYLLGSGRPLSSLPNLGITGSRLEYFFVGSSLSVHSDVGLLSFRRRLDGLIVDNVETSCKLHCIMC